MPFSTYIHGIRQGHATKTLAPILKRLTKLATSPTFDAAEIMGAEVRVTLPNGTERLYAVLAQDPLTGVLHLKDVEGHDTIISH